MFQRITIVGVGLIGGSFALALKKNGFSGEIIGYNRNSANSMQAVTLGVIDDYETDLSVAVEQSDCIVLAIPVGSLPDIFPAIENAIHRNVVVTDVGSTKGSVISAFRDYFGYVPRSFIPGHPIAGTEKSGVVAAFAELFTARRVILTPQPDSDATALQQILQLWQMAGAKVVLMDATRHDQVLAATSHLPHILAYALVDMLANLEEHDDIFRFAAGGFRDFSRIASSDPQMWHDICLNNKQELLPLIDRYCNELQTIATNIRNDDGIALLQQFRRAKQERDAFFH